MGTWERILIAAWLGSLCLVGGSGCGRTHQGAGSEPGDGDGDGDGQPLGGGGAAATGGSEAAGGQAATDGTPCEDGLCHIVADLISSYDPGTPGSDADPAVDWDAGIADIEAPERAAEYRAAEIAVRCAVAERCCEAWAYAGPIADCAEAFEDRSPELGDPARYDQSMATACLREIAAQPCAAGDAGRTSDAPCAKLYRRGDRELGEPCEHYTDCAQPEGERISCEVAAVTADGIERACKRLRYVSVGESCRGGEEGVSTRCEPGLMCGDGEVCVAPAELGQPCLTGTHWGDTCGPGAVCDRQDTKRCVPALPVGAACSEPEQCEGLRCDEGICRGVDYFGYAQYCSR